MFCRRIENRCQAWENVPALCVGCVNFLCKFKMAFFSFFLFRISFFSNFHPYGHYLSDDRIKIGSLVYEMNGYVCVLKACERFTLFLCQIKQWIINLIRLNTKTFTYFGCGFICTNHMLDTHRNIFIIHILSMVLRSLLYSNLPQFISLIFRLVCNLLFFFTFLLIFQSKMFGWKMYTWNIIWSHIATCYMHSTHTNQYNVLFGLCVSSLFFHCWSI